MDNNNEKKIETPKPKIKKKKKSKRCKVCRKKVGMFGFTCKCGELFCGKHRYASQHECTYDYRKDRHADILKNNPDMSFKKIINI